MPLFKPPAIFARAHLSANGTAGTAASINFDTVDFDTASAITTGAGWKFTCPYTGYYLVSCWIVSAGTSLNYFIYKNGTIYSPFLNTQSTGNGPSSTALVSANGGDTIDVRPPSTQTIDGSGSVTSTQSWIAIIGFTPGA